MINLRNRIALFASIVIVSSSATSMRNHHVAVSSVHRTLLSMKRLQCISSLSSHPCRRRSSLPWPHKLGFTSSSPKRSTSSHPCHHRSSLSRAHNLAFTFSPPNRSRTVSTNAKHQTLFDDIVDTLFLKHEESVPSTTKKMGCAIDEYWHDATRRITKPSARAIVPQLNPMCPMGYDPMATPSSFNRDTVRTPTTATRAGKKGSLLSYVRDQKQKFPDCVILTRVGEFYESFGLDAIMLMEHCGLNAMGGKARAGCPVKNIQATLDCLVEAGFRVAVYEEAADTDSSLGSSASAGSKSRLKNRMLAQIVSSASPTYMYNLILDDSCNTRDTLYSSSNARPHVGIISTSAGYTFVEVSMEERTVRLEERITKEAVACRLASFPPAEPLFYVPSMSEELSNKAHSGSSNIQNLPFLPSRSDSASDGPGSLLKVKVLPPSVFLQQPSKDISDAECAKRCIMTALFRTTESSDDGSNQLTMDDFISVAGSSSSDSIETQTKPLHVESATQLGLMNDAAIPNLVQHLVSDVSPASTKRLLRRWLLIPPPPRIADSISKLVQSLKQESVVLPPLSVPPIGKCLSLIRAGQASAEVFKEISAALHATIHVLNTGGIDNTDYGNKTFIDPLMTVLQYETGISADRSNLKERCLDAVQIINEVVNVQDLNAGLCSEDDIISDFGTTIPQAFFERNEASWRGRIRKESCISAYTLVEEASQELARAVMADFWGGETLQSSTESSKQKTPVVQDVFNNILALKEIPSWVSDRKQYYHPKDRNGKVLRTRYTTQDVQDALVSYIDACEEASKAVMKALSELSETLCETGHMPTITQASHANLILSTAFHHAAQANILGWESAGVTEVGPSVESDDGSRHFSARFVDLWPYWLDRSEAVLNSFDLDGLFLLTAPNMSGKSTLMRSMAAAALLSCCGLCAPLKSTSSLRRFDSIYVRGASSDVPSENKSAFGAEMEDIAALFRTCGDRSLIAVDELGRGTSPTDGTSLAGAVLEEMALKSMSGIFATHLHGILNLPLNDTAVKRIINKKMVVEAAETSNGIQNVKWTYRLEDGVCMDSLALVTAARFGIPIEILNRANEFSSCLGKRDHHDSDNTSSNSDDGISTGFEIDGEDESLQAFMKDVTENEHIIYIPPFWSSPPSLEGHSCVYILSVGSQKYVGETDSLSQRLRQHRSKGKKWASLQCYAVQVKAGKSEARNIESRLIRRLVKEGYDMISVSDGVKIRRNRSSI